MHAPSAKRFKPTQPEVDANNIADSIASTMPSSSDSPATTCVGRPTSTTMLAINAGMKVTDASTQCTWDLRKCANHQKQARQSRKQPQEIGLEHPSFIQGRLKSTMAAIVDH
jgi:hypothetical protein